jgi:hypothetical protein
MESMHGMFVPQPSQVVGVDVRRLFFFAAPAGTLLLT